MRSIFRQPDRAEPARMGALSTLPVFFTLRGKAVIVAGGTDAAAWKAELLAASGACVAVYARAGDVSGEMQTLVVRGAADGDIRLVDADWRDADFSNMALVVGDIEAQDAPDFVAQARKAGVPVNVIDKPAFCDFQFGSIVNRSPVVVGISTDGAAPILGQAVRRRIETLLPATLGAWGAIAQGVREITMRQRHTKPGRKRQSSADTRHHTNRNTRPFQHGDFLARAAKNHRVTRL